ncbi:2-hydroxyacid dehydrogenase [Sphingomonas crusticola]|uniref:2-hydroxyacid dehydrogenase n=1 Tax=Sphingomonas crusticola TaxID=1697973 RepID=UPI000E234A53|nr:2-hydroxyacid dehydrogenase [Sphingomonas crusticola]
MPTRPIVVVAQPHLARLIGALEGRYEPLPLWEEASRPRLGEGRALVVAGEFPLDPALIGAMPQLGLIACFTVGYDGVDVPAMRARGIAVAHAHDANDEDVADHAIGLIIAHRRQIVAGDRAVRNGGWTSGAKMLTRSLGHARIGIVGMGSIGQALARRAEAMRMRVSWWGPRAKPDLAWPRLDSLIALAENSDILVVAARADSGNRKMISGEIMDALGPDGLLVNIARGQLIDEDALIARLRDGRLGGAALDVFAQEPTPSAHWAEVPNVVLTPHTAGATDAAVARMTAMLIANLDAFFRGAPLPTPVP